MSRAPIRLRVTAAFALTMAAVLAGSGLFLYLRLSSHLALALDRELRQRAQDLAAVVGAPGVLARDRGGRLVERGESYAQLVAADGRVLDATRPVERTPLLTRAELRAALRRPLYRDVPPVPGLDEGSRLLATRARAGGTAVLVVGRTRQDDVETLASFRDELLIAGPLALLLASVAGYLLAGASLRQVEAMRRRAAEISADGPGERLPVPATGDELEQLGRTLNAMLERLELALERERDFVADAGHELRTPLALLRTELELALRQAGSAAELRAAVGRAQGEAERLSQLAEDLLVVARADRGGLRLQRERLDADRLLAAVASRFEWRVEELGKTLRRGPPAGLEVDGDALRLEQALGNLVDNALRHGGGAVSLDAVAVDGGVELHVRDDGAGFGDDFLPRAFDRFSRPDPGRSGGGAGLGLAIARTIARSHGGDARAANRAGGADVWLTLPRAGRRAAPGAPRA